MRRKSTSITGAIESDTVVELTEFIRRKASLAEEYEYQGLSKADWNINWKGWIVLIFQQILLAPFTILELIYQTIIVFLATVYKFLFSKISEETVSSVLDLCGGEELFSAKRTLLFVLLDFLSDIGTAANHFRNGRNPEGILTVAIVVVSGFMVSIIVGISKHR